MRFRRCVNEPLCRSERALKDNSHELQLNHLPAVEGCGAVHWKNLQLSLLQPHASNAARVNEPYPVVLNINFIVDTSELKV